MEVKECAILIDSQNSLNISTCTGQVLNVYFLMPREVTKLICMHRKIYDFLNTVDEKEEYVHE